MHKYLFLLAFPNFRILENSVLLILTNSLSLDPKSIKVDCFVTTDVFKGPGVKSNFFLFSLSFFFYIEHMVAIEYFIINN